MELKSRAGVAIKAQKQVCAELRSAGADWWLARSACAVMMHHSSVVFLRLAMEAGAAATVAGPFADPNHRLPQAPDVAARRAAARNRWREHQHATRNATQRPTARPRAGTQTAVRESAD